MLRGTHYLKSWSATQKSITLSSGEAEVVAAVKMSTEVLGMCQLSAEWGIELQGEVYVDSSAALGVARRKGNSKMRNIRVGLLWIQQKSEDGTLLYRKVLGLTSPGDLMTKYLGQKVIDKLMDLMYVKFAEGRADKSLRII